MKKLILILVIVFPILANAQDYRVIDWKTDVLNVQTINTDTFKFETEIKDYNDPGAITREIGNYFIDFVARCFKIIGSDANTITVVDLEHINSAPQSNQIGRVYQSVVDADSLFESIGGVDISVLDQMSIYRDVARNNEIICRLLKELYLKDATYRQKTDHDSLSMLDEKSYNSLTDKPDLTSYRLKTDHDSLSNLDEKSYNSLTDKPASLPASDVYPWAKAATKPTYTYSEVGAQPAGSYLTSEVDGSTTNEIQDLSRAGNTLSLSSDGTSVDLSDLVNPDLTSYRQKSDHDSLSALDEKSYNSLTDKPNLSVYLTSEVDGSTTNEIQDLSRAGNTLSLSGDATTVDLSDLVNPDLTSYRQKSDHDSLSALDEKSYNSLTDKPNLSVYLTSEVDGSTTNEIQDLSRAGNTLSLSSDGTSVDLSDLVNPDLTSYRQKSDHDSLSALDEKSYNSLTDKPNLSVYLTSEVDGSTTNEIQDLSRAGNTLSLSGDATTVDLSDLVNPDLTGYRLKTDHDSLSNLDEKSYNSLTDKPASLPASDVYAWAKAATKPTYTYSEVGAQPAGSYLTSEVDGSTTNEIQSLSRTGNTLSLSGDETTVDLSDLVNPDLTSYRQKTDHDSLSALDEKSYNSLTDKPNLSVYLTSEVDGSTTNEIQDLSRTGNTLSLSGDGTTVDLSDLAAPDLSGYATTTQLADQLSQTISNGITTKAPSEDAVYDALAGKATISGADNYIMKKTGDNTLGNSIIYESGGKIGVATTTPRAFFDVPFSSVIGNTDIRTDGGIILNNRGTGNRYAFIDFKGDSVYLSPFRIIRYNTGENAKSEIIHRGTGDFRIITQDAASFQLYTKSRIALNVDTLQRFGFGTLTPAARIHSQSTQTQLRLGYDATKYTDLSTNSAGTFNIAPSGGFTTFSGGISASAFSTFTGQVEMTGLDVNLGASTVLRKNGSDVFTAPITMGACGSAGQVLTSTGLNSAPTWTTPATGSGSGITSIGIQVPTGLTVSPASLTANGTFTIGLQSGYSIPTTANQTNWSTAYTNRITSAVGTTPLALSISNNTLSGYLSWTLTNINNATPSVGYLYYNGSTYSYQAATTTYTLPTASNSTLGGVKVATDDGGLYMSGGFLLQKDNVLTTRTPEVSDYIAFYDNSATAQGKMTLSTLGSLIGGGGSGLWTSTSGGMYYNSGSVSIGTTDVGAIRLKVYSSNTANTFEAENSTWADAIRGYNSGEGTGVSGSSQTGVGGQFSSASSFGIRCFGTGMQLGNGAGIWSINSGTRIINPNGSFSPPSLADNVAANNSMYYSTTQNKLVYKDPSGVVHALY